MSNVVESNKTKTLTNIIMYLLFAVLILGLLAGIISILNAPSGIYVVYGEENITSENSGIMIEWSEEANAVTFTVQNSDDWGAYTVQDCTVKVIPNVASKNDFEFTADGDTNLFSIESDLTAAFVEDYTTYGGDGFVIDEDGAFTFYLPEFTSYNLSVAMSEWLSRVYGGSEVRLSSGVDIFSACYFAFEIISPDGSTDYIIPFTLYTDEVIYSVTVYEVNLNDVDIDPYNGGKTVGYIIQGDTLTIDIQTLVSGCSVLSIETENALFYKSGSDDLISYYSVPGGIAANLVFTVCEATDNVDLTIYLYYE